MCLVEGKAMHLLFPFTSLYKADLHSAQSDCACSKSNEGRQKENETIKQVRGGEDGKLRWSKMSPLCPPSPTRKVRVLGGWVCC